MHFWDSFPLLLKGSSEPVQAGIELGKMLAKVLNQRLKALVWSHGEVVMIFYARVEWAGSSRFLLLNS